MSHISQNRVELKNFEASERASQETLFFVATVYFDGKRIATARNTGTGGVTTIQAIDKSTINALKDAEAFARTLPPDEIVNEVTLDYLVDKMAHEIQMDRIMRRAFTQCIANKLLFIKGGQLLYQRGLKLKSYPNKSQVFAQLRAQHREPIVILAELPREEAYVLYKKYAQKGAGEE